MAYRRSINEGRPPRIVVSKFGKVKPQEEDHILDLAEECYRRLEPHEVTLVDLYLFERSSSMTALMAREFKEVGVTSASFDELFFAMHDAYRGTSRITLCLERMKKLPKLVEVGGIRHEVGHSVLHGSLLYYLLSLPQSLLDLVNRSNVSQEYAINLLYLVSIAVKDYEVSRLLYKRGYFDDQVAYAKHLLATSESDELSWNLSRGKPLAEILCLVSCLKTAGCIAPFLRDKALGEELGSLLKDSLSYLPTHSSKPLFSMVKECFPSLGTDTLSNINDFSYLVVENLVNPTLQK